MWSTSWPSPAPGPPSGRVYAGPGATVLMRTGVACRPTVGVRITNSLDTVSRAVAPSQDGEQTADYLGMQGLLASVIAVVGMLLGSTVTFVFQRVNAGRVERFARDERLRQERIAAYSGFAGRSPNSGEESSASGSSANAMMPHALSSTLHVQRLIAQGQLPIMHGFGCSCLPKTLISWRWPTPRSNRSVRYTMPQIGLSWWSMRTGARIC